MTNLGADLTSGSCQNDMNSFKFMRASFPPPFSVLGDLSSIPQVAPLSRKATYPWEDHLST
jgi:hypothetical protein